MKKKDFLPLKEGRMYTLLSTHLTLEVLEVDSKTGRAHGIVRNEIGITVRYCSWWAETGEPLGGETYAVAAAKPSWEDEFPWDVIHEDYKWASRDSEAARNGVEWEVWSECPVVLNTERGVIHERASKSKHAVLHSRVLLLPVPPGGGPACIKRPE